MNIAELELSAIARVAGVNAPAGPALLNAKAGGPAPAAAPQTQSLLTLWVQTAEQLLQAQQLRYRVFIEEMGATPPTPACAGSGLDCDAFDPFCEHLIVQTAASEHSPSQVVGTYRVLTPAAARRAGGLYSDTEFDLSRLQPLRGRIAELGRSCVDPAWRQGGVILMLWAALADFMQRNGLDITVGCASVSMHDGGHSAASLWHQLQRCHAAPEPWSAQPHLPLPLLHLRSDLQVSPPSLIKGYLRCGGCVLGPPAWDPQFGTADLPMMLNLADMPAAYRRRFFAG